MVWRMWILNRLSMIIIGYNNYNKTFRFLFILFKLKSIMQ